MKLDFLHAPSQAGFAAIGTCPTLWNVQTCVTSRCELVIYIGCAMEGEKAQYLSVSTCRGLVQSCVAVTVLDAAAHAGPHKQAAHTLVAHKGCTVQRGRPA
eukprot:6181129-Pleurochrysis_carterae.AAC.1